MVLDAIESGSRDYELRQDRLVSADFRRAVRLKLGRLAIALPHFAPETVWATITIIGSACPHIATGDDPRFSSP